MSDLPLRRRVVITGIGPITAVGVGRQALWDGLKRAQSPIRRLTRFDASSFRSQLAAEVDEFAAETLMDRSRARRLDRFGHFSIGAGRLALDDACLDPSSVDPDRVAVQAGSALAGIAHAEGELGKFLAKGIRGVDPRLALKVFGGAASCNMAIEFGFTGPNLTNGMSCASGTIAVGEAWKLIRNGEADVALAGGVEAPLAQLSFGAFANIRAMSSRNQDPAAACRPFDAERDGFVMGEGACMLVLEERGGALARGAHIYAELCGYGTTNDAHHMTAPRPDGSQAARAMSRALTSAGMTPDDIDYVNAHGSSTLLNDSTETRAIHRAMGARATQIPISGTKPYYGHALGASGAIEVGICAMILENGWVPPTLNHEEPGEGCDLDYVPESGGRAVQARALLTNSFGFGGINATLVLAAHPEN